MFVVGVLIISGALGAMVKELENDMEGHEIRIPSTLPYIMAFVETIC
jgi:hypothetical protein